MRARKIGIVVRAIQMDAIVKKHPPSKPKIDAFSAQLARTWTRPAFWELPAAHHVSKLRRRNATRRRTKVGIWKQNLTIHGQNLPRLFILPDGVLTRGCFGDLPANEACTDKTCATCVNEGCNGKVFPTDRLRCYQCTTTDSDKTCSNQLTGEAKSSYCTLYKDGDKCYSRISEGVCKCCRRYSEWTFRIIVCGFISVQRGCQSNLKAADPCDGLTAKQCLTCAGENCNGISEERLKNSAGQKAISSILVAAVVAFVVLK